MCVRDPAGERLSRALFSTGKVEDHARRFFPQPSEMDLLAFWHWPSGTLFGYLT